MFMLVFMISLLVQRVEALRRARQSRASRTRTSTVKRRHPYMVNTAQPKSDTCIPVEYRAPEGIHWNTAVGHESSDFFSPCIL